MGVRTLFHKMQNVGKCTQLALVKKGKDKPLTEADDTPMRHTEMSKSILMSAGNIVFEMKKSWRGHNNNNDNLEEEELINPEVYFTFSISTGKELTELLSKVCVEWGKLGGKKLWLKRIPSFNTATLVVIYNMLNSIHEPTLVPKIIPIFRQAHNNLDMELIAYI